MKIMGLSARIRENVSILLIMEKLERKLRTLFNANLKLKTDGKVLHRYYGIFYPNKQPKLYLSPILDGYNSEIIAYTLSSSPNLKQVKDMLEQAFREEQYENTILHSDQGWQYQHESYHKFFRR